MAVDFLTVEQKARYAQYVEESNDTQLARYFLLDKTDLAFMGLITDLRQKRITEIKLTLMIKYGFN